jgi:hypothetical protein
MMDQYFLHCFYFLQNGRLFGSDVFIGVGLFLQTQALLDITPGRLASTGVLIKSLARPGRKQATATEDFDVHIYYL